MIKPSKSLDWQQQEFANKHGWIKVFKVDGPEQLLAAWNKLKSPNTTLMAQEFIPGDDNGHYSYYSYRNSNAVEIANLCVRKSRVLPIHGGNGTFFEPEENHQIQTIATELLDKLGYTGIVSVCFKWNSLTNKPIVHEVNGRMPQGNGAFQACDIDLPYIIYRDMLGEELPLTTPKLNRKFFFFVRDLDAMREYRQAKELRLRDWFRSFGPKPYCAEFAWDDMLPFFWSLRSLLQRSMSKTKKTITAKAQTIGA